MSDRDMFTTLLCKLQCCRCSRIGAYAECEVGMSATGLSSVPIALRCALLAGLISAGWVTNSKDDPVCPVCKELKQ